MNTRNQEAWLKFSRSSWDAAGRPKGLDPDNILNDPVEYDRSYYHYFERRYFNMWFSIYSRINPNDGSFLRDENDVFKEAWRRNFDWHTIWKQTLPLLVYGTSLGAGNDVLVELASWYCIGQAIPSMVVDRILDNDTHIEKHSSDVAFCMLSYIKALKGLRAMGLPNSSGIEDTFLDLTAEMYEKMFTEHNNRFKPLPEYTSDAIQEYLLPGSRLLSSVFFGILPIWAYMLTDHKLKKEIHESLKKLRMVRQLNDEILDAEGDLNHGLLTLPWLYAMEEKPELRNLIEKQWKYRNRQTLKDNCFKKLESSGARKRAVRQSKEFLSQSMKITMKHFRAENAFDITLLHNVRWALLNWLEKENFKRNPGDIYNPHVPQEDFAGTPESIEPVPGGGVVVYNSAKQVYLSLVLKRGMFRWEIPAGRSIDEESLEETAKREFLEETGRNVEVGDAIASCWHYSKILNKGWMGLFFKGNIKKGKDEDPDQIMIVAPQAFVHNKFDMHKHPEVYRPVNLCDCDFEELLKLCSRNLHSTMYEYVIASGFVDWKKIPVGRIHPLHKDLLEALETSPNNEMIFLCADADEDFTIYDGNSKLYFNN